MAQPLPRAVRAILAVMVLGMIPLACLGVWHGWSTIQADQRMTASGLTVQGRITTLSDGRRGTVSSAWSGRSASVGYAVPGEAGRERRVQVGRATFDDLAWGQTITLRVDPDDPDRQMLDPSYEVWVAWLMLGFFGLLLPMLLALLVWMARGGMSDTTRRV